MPNTKTVRISFEITIPDTSDENALRLMGEVEGVLTSELDNADSIFEEGSFEEIYGEDNDGYSFGFGDAEIVR